MDCINLAFVTDKKFLQYTSITLLSAVEHCKKKIRAYILYTGADESDLIRFHDVFMGKNVIIKFIQFDKSKYERFQLNNSYISLTTYAKFEIPDLVDEEKILYLDSDVIVSSDLSNLWDLFDNKRSIMAVCNPPYSKWKDSDVLGLKDTQRTFNAGVLFFNVNKIRSEKSTIRLFEFANQNHHRIKLHDEAAYNFVYMNDWSILPYKYNLTTLFFRRRYKIVGITKQENKEMIKNKVIIHYSGKDKPWNYISPHPYNRIWRKTYKKYYPNTYFDNITLKLIFKRAKRKIKYLASYLTK